MQIAKRAGFCFGVSRAVKLAYDGLDSGKKIVTLGPIIHNQNVTDELERRGAEIINAPEEAKNGDTVIIRSHGITKAEQEKLEKNGMFVYESVPGTTVRNLTESEVRMEFEVEGCGNTQITVELENEKEYTTFIDGINAGTVKTNLGGKMTISVELGNNGTSKVRIVQA